MSYAGLRGLSFGGLLEGSDHLSQHSTERETYGCKLLVLPGVGITSSSSLISQHNDVSGKGHNLTATSTARPTLVTGVVAGLSVDRFDGTANVLATASNTDVASVAFGCAWTASITSYGAASHEGGMAGLANGAWIVETFNQAGTGKILLLANSNQSVVGAAVGTGAFHRYLIAWDGTTGANACKLYLDGALYAQVTPTAANPGTSTALKFGQKTSVAGTFFNGDFAGLALWNRVPSSAEIRKDWLMSRLRYGL